MSDNKSPEPAVPPDDQSAAPGNTLLARTIQGLMWSMVQSWGGKALQFLLFLFLARLLTQEEFGLAIAVSTLLLLLAAVAEFGFGEALIQRRELEDRDINLPFFASMIASLALGGALALTSSTIEAWSGYDGLAPLMVVAGLILPLTTASAFQEALYKRHLDFRTLAVRQIVALTVSGVVAVACAFAGWGAMSMVIQQLVFIGISVVWLWSRPKWLPFLSINAGSLRSLARYSVNVVSNRILDFFTTRTVELLILGAYGAAGLGVYAVGARVYITLIQLFVTAVIDVSISALSKISHEADRLRASYYKSLSLSAFLTVPVFVGVAAMSEEYTILLFGPKWAEAAGVMMPLMLVGSVQGVQFINGAYFASLGKPHITLSLNILKFVTVVGILAVVPMSSITQAAIVFATAQLVTTPFSFGLICRHTGVRIGEILWHIIPYYAAAFCSFAAVHYARQYIAGADVGLLVEAVALSFLFGVIYMMAVLILVRKRTIDLFHFIKNPQGKVHTAA